MCGILGQVGTKSDNLPLQLLHHRGPDATGEWQNHDVQFGHTRLAIIDLSDGGKQPKTDYSGRFSITFNGEIYNFKELKQQLRDYPFQTQSDTEVILAAYSQFGYHCVNYLKGQFAFAIWDNQQKELYIARDRMGEKPFYYWQNENQFCFSSEIRALLYLTNHSPILRIDSLSEYLRFQSVQAPNTLLEGIFQLPAAHYGIFKKGNLTIENYWDITQTKQTGSDLFEIKKTIKNKLSQSVHLQMLSDVPLGAFLSGGIDSSAIVALMAEQSEQRIDTFSIGFKEAQFDESQYARVIAQKFNTRHHEIILNANDFKNRIPDILSKVDNPSGDGPNTFIVSEAVKKRGLTVALSGLGGDELFAGYDGFKRFYHLQQFSKPWKWSFGLRKMGSTAFKGKQKELLELPTASITNFYPLQRSVFSVSEVAALVPNSTNKNTYLESVNTGALPILSQYSVAELTGYTQSVLLKDTDQMSMANSLEVRVPFFDHDLIEYVLGIPDAIKYPTFAKSLLVESLHPLLPDEIVHRPKMGFSFPWEDWLRGDLKAYCEQQLQALSNRGILSKSGVEQLWNRFLNRDKDVKWSKIWLLVSLEQWLKNIGL